MYFNTLSPELNDHDFLGHKHEHSSNNNLSSIFEEMNYTKTNSIHSNYETQTEEETIKDISNMNDITFFREDFFNTDPSPLYNSTLPQHLSFPFPLNHDGSSNKAFSHPRFMINKKTRKKYTKPKKEISNEHAVYKCDHCNCSNYFQTLKQKASHHHKMNTLCTNDSVVLMKLIAVTKKLFYHTFFFSRRERNNSARLAVIKAKYEATLRHLKSLDDYFQCIAGKEFDDCLTDDDDDDDCLTDDDGQE